MPGQNVQELETGSRLGMEWRDGKLAEAGSTRRVQQLNRLLHSYRPNLDIHLTRCFTKIYQETEGEPYLSRKYKACAETFRTLPAVIYDHEQIAGWQGKKIWCDQFHIEMHAHWIDADLDEMRIRRFDPFEIDDEDLEELRAVHIPYWKDKTLAAVWAKRVPFPEKMVSSGIADCLNYLGNSGSHFIPGYARLFETGYKGYQDLARECLDRIDPNDPGDIGKKEFYEGIIEVLDAIKTLAHNYAAKARELASKETRAQRKEELLEIAKVMDRVPWNPPRTFREAIQTVWLTEMILCVEASGPSISYGRFDQYMYPYYKRDIEQGVLTPEKAMELIEELYIKTTNVPWLLSTQLAYFHGGYFRFAQMGVGGVDKQGRDASNDLSYLCLRAMRHVRTTAPSVALYLHAKTPDSLLLEAVKLSAEGMGHPSFFNVETYSKMLEYRGGGLQGKSPYTREQILEAGSPNGCVEPGMAGFQYGHCDSGIVNLGAVMNLALGNGIKPAGLLGWGAGERCGPPTGDPRIFKTFQELMGAVQTQLEFAIKEIHAHMIVAEKIITEQHPLPTFSILSQGCIEKGVDVAAGGAYCNIGPTIQAIGLADMANSLAAIKKLVYEKGEITMDELCDALAANFENNEILRMKLRKAPKYGNDDDYADNLACEIFQFFADTVRSLKCYRGNYSDAAIQMGMSNVGFGVYAWALPSGRLAATPLADTMSAEQQTDINGPTMAARSYGKLNIPAFTNGTILNMWISRSELIK